MITLELVVLGCHAGMPAWGRGSSGYLVETGTSRILLDCGPGVATALSGHGGVGGLDAVIISHLHPDHCYDLLPLGTMLARPGLREAPVALYGPRGTGALLHQLAGVFPLVREAGRVVPFYESFAVKEYLPGEVFSVGECLASLVGLRHVVENCGVRLEDASGTMAYTGDTGPTPALVGLASGVDLLLAEATLAIADRDYGHLSATDAARVAADAEVGQLVLTHLGSTDPAWIRARGAEATGEFTGPIHIAHPGARYRVRPAEDSMR